MRGWHFHYPKRRKITLKSLCIFSVTVIILWITMSGNIFAAEEANSIMCDNGVVNIGDMDVAVQDACGEPDSQGMTEWVYNFGPSQPVYTLIFKDGRLVKILENEWGS